MIVWQGISVDPDIMGGQPCIAVTRIPARAIYHLARAGYSVNRIISEYPGLTPLEIANALAWSAMPAKMRKEWVDG